MRRYNDVDREVVKKFDDLEVKDRLHVIECNREFGNVCISVEGQEPVFYSSKCRIFLVEEW